MSSRYSKDLLFYTVLACLLFSIEAHAQPYAGIGFGGAKQDTVCVAGGPCSNSKPAVKLVAGYQFDQVWSGELTYLRTGMFTASDSSAAQTWSGSYQAQVLGASAGYNFSVGDLQWQVRAGLAAVQADFVSATAGVPNSNASILQALLGFGLRHQVTPGLTLRLDLDATRSKAYTRSGNLSLFSIGLEQRF